MKINTIRVRNILLFLTLVFSYTPRLFYGTTKEISLGLFIIRQTRLDFFTMYYVNAINFLILAWCVYDNRGINKTIAKFILLITFLDIIHLVTLSGQHFEVLKLVVAFLLLLLWEKRKFVLLVNTVRQHLFHAWQKHKHFLNL